MLPRGRGATGTRIGGGTVRALDTPPPNDKEAPGPEPHHRLGPSDSLPARQPPVHHL